MENFILGSLFEAKINQELPYPLHENGKSIMCGWGWQMIERKFHSLEHSGWRGFI